MPYVHEYFERKPSAWDILDFLDEYDQEPIIGGVAGTFKISVIQAFNASHEVGIGRRWILTLPTFKNLTRPNTDPTGRRWILTSSDGSRPDRVRRQNWEKDHTTCEKAVHSVNFYGDSHKIESINNGSILDTKRKRSQETSKPEKNSKRKKKDHNISDTDESMSDDCMELPSVANSVTAKKLSEIGEGIARYSVIFLPECHKNDILRSKFSDYEWRNFENIFCKKDIEISAKIVPPLDKVEQILKEYNESIDNATDGVYVDLDSFDMLSTLEACSKRRINQRIPISNGEIENTDRKNQKDLSKLPEDRRPTGWFHDGIIKININGNNLQVGFLEVVGNAIVKDHKKIIGDLQKILKEKGVVDEKKLRQMIETFGILVDRRDFAFFAMNYYDGAYLARVEYLNTRIIELLRDATSRRRSRRTTTAVDVSPQNAEKTRRNSIKK
ncbi:10922_t:CDS:10 [Rhizophagus irregularis]|nr:10922_t:CDS:10 [Rhizophagus irregularis]